jgi:hypothetical protein
MLYRHFSTFLQNMQLGMSKKNQVGLKLNGTHQLLLYADDVTLLGDKIDTILLT